MKYKHLLAFSICLMFFQAFSQDTLTFRVHYMPEKVYRQTLNQTNKISIQYLGTEEFLQKLKESGITNPIEQSTSAISEMVLETGKLNDENYFPLTMRFLKMPSEEVKKLIGDSLVIYGRGTIDSMPKLDSIVSTGTDSDFKNLLLGTLQSTFSQIDFPVKKLKVGGSFVHETPFVIPLGNFSMDMMLHSTYKLLSIEDNTGTFDITQIYTVKSDIAGAEMKASGKGTGKLLYDVNDKFVSKMDTDNILDMNMNIRGVNTVMKMEMKISQTVKISKN